MPNIIIDGQSVGRTPEDFLSSLFTPPQWLTTFMKNTPTTTLSHFPMVSGLWSRAQTFIDRMGSAKTVDDRLRHVLGWVVKKHQQSYLKGILTISDI